MGRGGGGGRFSTGKIGYWLYIQISSEKSTILGGAGGGGGRGAHSDSCNKIIFQ